MMLSELCAVALNINGGPLGTVRDKWCHVSIMKSIEGINCTITIMNGEYSELNDYLNFNLQWLQLTNNTK